MNPLNLSIPIFLMDNLIHKLRNMANTLRLVYEQDRAPIQEESWLFMGVCDEFYRVKV